MIIPLISFQPTMLFIIEEKEVLVIYKKGSNSLEHFSVKRWQKMQTIFYASSKQLSA